MHQYSGVKKGYRPARTSRGYRSSTHLGQGNGLSRLHAAPTLAALASAFCARGISADFLLHTAYWGTQTKTKKPRELTSSNFIARPRNSPTPTSPTR